MQFAFPKKLNEGYKPMLAARDDSRLAPAVLRLHFCVRPFCVQLFHVRCSVSCWSRV